MRCLLVSLSVVLLLLPLTARAECPRACSGNGECGPKDTCACYDRFVGADCSQQVCPQGLAFVDVAGGDLNHDGVQGSTTSPALWASAYSEVQGAGYKAAESWPTLAGLTYGDPAARTAGRLDPSKINGGGWAAAGDEAHFYAECSGKGACERSSGMCTCYAGFEGAACQRLTCPNACSGHGLCRTVRDIAATKATKRLVDSAGGVNTYSGPQDYFVYRLWDADKHRACACDAGYGGFDCSARECPRGDDPLTTTAATCGGVPCADEVQVFMVAPGQGAGGEGIVQYRLRFFDYNGVALDTREFGLPTRIDYGDASPAGAARAAAVAADIAAALGGLPNGVTGAVRVALSGNGAAGANILARITFTGLPGNVPDMNLLPGASPAGAGSPAIAQPFQRVQTLTLSGLATSSVLAATIFPLNLTSVRKDPALTAKAANGAVVDDTTSDAAAGGRTTATLSAPAVQANILAALRAIPAIAYYGQSSVSAVTIASGADFVTTIIMPNADLGTNIVQWGITGAGSASEQAALTTDGNKEFSVCSNRGLCDASSGLCKCFAGYYGAACDTQAALAAGQAALSAWA